MADAPTDLQSQLAIDVAVLKERTANIQTDLTGLRGDLKNVYATKEELKGIAEDVKGLKNNQGWIIKIIVGAVLTAVLGLVILKGGAIHP